MSDHKLLRFYKFCFLCKLVFISDIRGEGLFFRPASRIVSFILQFKNSSHVITFLWLWGLQNNDHVTKTNGP